MDIVSFSTPCKIDYRKMLPKPEVFAPRGGDTVSAVDASFGNGNSSLSLLAAPTLMSPTTGESIRADRSRRKLGGLCSGAARRRRRPAVELALLHESRNLFKPDWNDLRKKSIGEDELRFLQWTVTN